MKWLRYLFGWVLGQCLKGETVNSVIKHKFGDAIRLLDGLLGSGRWIIHGIKIIQWAAS
jgi:hypothetical protein